MQDICRLLDPYRDDVNDSTVYFKEACDFLRLKHEYKYGLITIARQGLHYATFSQKSMVRLVCSFIIMLAYTKSLNSLQFTTLNKG